MHVLRHRDYRLSDSNTTWYVGLRTVLDRCPLQPLSSSEDDKDEDEDKDEEEEEEGEA